jgi:TonB family protein
MAHSANDLIVQFCLREGPFGFAQDSQFSGNELPGSPEAETPEAVSNSLETHPVAEETVKANVAKEITAKEIVADEIVADEIIEDPQLKKILEEACVTTGATGAAIALRRGTEMVCCASTGPDAPGLGARLDPHNGLSGCCIETRQPQQCSDTETDPRVNLEACRRLGVRSIVVLPLLDSDQAFGIFEILWSRPDAFGQHDLEILNTLANRILECKTSGSTAPATSPQQEQAANPQAVNPTEAERLASELFVASARRDVRIRRRHNRTSLLMAAVVALSLLLGWVMGRAGWNMAIDRAEGHADAPQEGIQKSAPEVPEAPAAAPVAEKTSSAPPEKTPASEGGAGALQTTKTEILKNDFPAAASVASNAIESYLITRVEPQYPSEAKRRHIQGRVVMNVLVGSDGLVRKLVVASGNPSLVEAATTAVRQWRFKPRNLDGQPAEFETRITVNFSFN